MDKQPWGEIINSVNILSNFSASTECQLLISNNDIRLMEKFESHPAVIHKDYFPD